MSLRLLVVALCGSPIALLVSVFLVPPTSRSESESWAVKSSAQMHSLQVTLARYASSKGGNYPASLDDLTPEFIDEAGFQTLSNDLDGLTYIPNLNSGMPGDTVILRMKPIGLPTKELVGYLDGSCSMIKLPRDSE